jgi:phospholipase/lecithinase/hemolysin
MKVVIPTLLLVSTPLSRNQDLVIPSEIQNTREHPFRERIILAYSSTDRGYTSSNGPNWIDYLTTTYNKSFIETVNLAYGGATVDSTLVAPYLPTVLSVKEQVQNEYLPIYASHFSPVPWTSEDTLFTIFIGINDIGNSYASQNSTLLPTIFTQLSNLIDQLYTSGARNFLFLNVPPVDQSPLTHSAGPSAQSLEATAIADWNTRLSSLSASLSKTHKDATSFIFNTHKVFSRVIEHPCAYPQTCAYKNTTMFCTEYQNGTPEPDTFDVKCGVPVDEYLWLNSLHPTYRMHEVIAEQIVKLIK